MRLFIDGVEVNLNSSHMVLVFADDNERIDIGAKIITGFRLEPNQIRLWGAFPKAGNEDLQLQLMDDLFDYCNANPPTLTKEQP